MLSGDIVGRLVVMQDRVINGVLVEQLTQVGLAVGAGCTEPGEQRPLVLLLDAPLGWPPALPQAATPYFALSPDGGRLAYWRYCPVQETETVGELVTLDLNSGAKTSLTPPQVLGQGGSLLWPLPSNLVFCAPRPLPDGNWGMVWRLDLGTGQTFCLLERPAGTTPGRLYPVASSEDVAYADALGSVIAPLTGAQARPVDLPRLLWANPAGDSWLNLAPRVELWTPVGPGPSLDLRATAAAWAPGGAAVLLASGGKLYVAPSDLSFARELTGWVGSPQEFIQLVWRASSAEGAAATLAPVPALHLFTLGTEHLSATFFFGASVLPRTGEKIWIARDFQLSAQGVPLKPIWPTLKACFAVARARPAEGGVIVDAENIGNQAGVLERVATERSPLANLSEIATVIGGRRVVWVERYDLAGRSDLRGWIDGVPALGVLKSLHVERRRLDAP